MEVRRTQTSLWGGDRLAVRRAGEPRDGLGGPSGRASASPTIAPREAPSAHAAASQVSALRRAPPGYTAVSTAVQQDGIPPDDRLQAYIRAFPGCGADSVTFLWKADGGHWFRVQLAANPAPAPAERPGRLFAAEQVALP